MKSNKWLAFGLALLTPSLLAGCSTNHTASNTATIIGGAKAPVVKHTLPPGDGAVEHPAHTPQTVQNPKLPSWLLISATNVSTISIQGWGPGADGNFTVYPVNGTSPRLINTLIDGLSSDKAIKPYTTPISQGGSAWIELKMKNGTTISLATFPNDPTPTQYIVSYDDKSQGPQRITMISDVSGKVTSVFDEINNKGKIVRQKTH